MMELYNLAFKLGMPVYKLLKEMPYEELLGWMDFLSKRPSGWEEDNRTYLLMSAQGTKAKPEDLFPSLRAIKLAQEQKEVTHADALNKAPSFLSFLNRTATRNGVDWKME